jgi:hypothetical protein
LPGSGTTGRIEGNGEELATAAQVERVADRREHAPISPQPVSPRDEPIGELEDVARREVADKEVLQCVRSVHSKEPLGSSMFCVK